MQPERRFVSTRSAPVRVEKRASDYVYAAGFAARFYDPGDSGTEYWLYDDLVERILPGAFDRAIAEDDVRALFNHDANQLLGRSLQGTLELSVRAQGLWYAVQMPDTTCGRDVMALIQRGDLTGSSFSFVPLQQNWNARADGTVVREIVEARLYDVGPVTFPAYESATVGPGGPRSCRGLGDPGPTVRAIADQQRAARRLALERSRRLRLAEADGPA